MNALDKIAILLAGLLALAACGTPPADTAAPSLPAETAASSLPAETAASSLPAPTAASFAADMGAIRAAGAAKDNAYNIGNADIVASLYENDAILMPPSVRTAKGQSEIRRFLLDYVARLAGGGYTLVVASAVDIGVSGNLGFRSGTYFIRDKSGALADSGKWLEVWNKSGETWRISRDIWNSDSLLLILMTESEVGDEPAM